MEQHGTTNRTPIFRQRLGRMLVSAGVSDAEKIEQALAVQKEEGGRLGSILVQMGVCTPTQLRAALRAQLGMPVVALDSLLTRTELLQTVPMEVVRRYEAIPWLVEDGVLTVAMVDPSNLAALDELRFATGFRHVEPVCCLEEDFDRYVEAQSASRSLIEEVLDQGEFYRRALTSVDGHDVDEESGPDVVEELREAGQQAPIITLCNYLLIEAVRKQASDIHIEPYETHTRVRLRMDGCLHTVLTPPQRLHAPIISRLKIRAGMDIAQRRVPQDGHIAIAYEGETIHMRVSTLPTVYGEKCVIRLMQRDENLHTLASLGFDEVALAALSRATRAPQGMLLVTGPTGSGKTTTLHAALTDINRPQINIVTLEDPVESQIAGINHVDTGGQGSVTFASGLRSILRQDPDVVFIGEMRDNEVTNIGVKAALTGHLVLSTLHTNSAAAALTRLADMGVAPYLLADALLLVVAQRLVRKVCEACVQPIAPTAPEAAEFGLTDEQLAGAAMQKGAGCPCCMDSGYRGRLGIYEVFEVTPALRTMIRGSEDCDTVVATARSEGMRTLYESGIARVLEGSTTFEELRRVVSKD